MSNTGLAVETTVYCPAGTNPNFEISNSAGGIPGFVTGQNYSIAQLSQPFGLDSVFNGGSSGIYFNGGSVSASGAIGAGTISNMYFGSNGYTTPHMYAWSGFVCSEIVTSAALSAADVLALTHWRQGYYNVAPPLPSISGF